MLRYIHKTMHLGIGTTCQVDLTNMFEIWGSTHVSTSTHASHIKVSPQNVRVVLHVGIQ
jgi:hypothetical protein